MMRLVTITTFVILLASCRRVFDAPVPKNNWPAFNAASPAPLPANTRSKMEGVYAVKMGSDVFGGGAALKWTYHITGTDTTYYLSIFCPQDAALMICQGRRTDSTILLNGYWRKPVSTETGRVQLRIAPDSGGRYLLRSANPGTAAVWIEGYFGYGEETPQRLVNMQFQKNLPLSQSFEIVAHRGGGRTADLLPASENSLPMIRMASRYGATGIEVDVRMTKDGVPILYHDATLNERLIQKNGMVGPISNYTYDQLATLVRLTRGEKIPTLREALETVLQETPLRFVWLDTKYEGSLAQVRQLQQEYMERAAARGRSLLIVIGIPDETVLGYFKQLPGYSTVPSLSELTTGVTQEINAKYWAPQWTGGLQQAETRQMQQQGKKVIPWTLDIPANIQDYLARGSFDGILSNYPSSVAYFYYARR